MIRLNAISNQKWNTILMKWIPQPDGCVRSDACDFLVDDAMTQPSVSLLSIVSQAGGWFSF
jgi:hypothetical protein